MNGYGDRDPEDVYDAGDPPDIRLAILERVVDDLDADAGEPRREGRRVDALRLVANLDGVAGVDPTRLQAVRDALEAM